MFRFTRPAERAGIAILFLAWLAVGCRDPESILAPEATSAGKTAGDLETGEIARLIESDTEEILSLTSHAREIRGPVVITESGRYRVTRDFSVPEGDGIVVRADHVRLDLGDHKITGPGNKIGRGIVIENAEEVLVEGGVLKRFGVGIALVRANHCGVRYVRVKGGDELADPPEIPPQIGILIVNSVRNRIRRNRIEDVNLGLFVRGGDSEGNRITRNRMRADDNGLLAICYNPAEGEGSAGPHDDTVVDNVLKRFATGIATSAGSEDNRFLSNRIEFFDEAWTDANGSNIFRRNRTKRLER
jgi:hypothetical protein